LKRKLKVAVLGGGGILGAHAPGFNRLSDICEVVAVAEPDASRHDRIRGLLHGGFKIYDSYDDVIAHADIDAVDILLPHDLHMDAAVKAAGRGLHVLCEKVMARNVYECNAMIEACKKAGVLLVISHDRRYAGDWVALKQVVESGELGEILFIKMEHNQDVNPTESSWIFYADRLGGGAIMSCLCHQIDALRWYFGEVDKISCMHKTLPSRMEGECIGAINAAMKSGALATLNINWYTQSNTAKNGLWYEFNHVTGTKGEAYYMAGNGTFLKMNSRFGGPDNGGGFVKVETEQTISGHEKCIEEFVKAARGEEARVLTFGDDAVKTVEAAEAAYISAATDATVKLPIAPVPWDKRIY